MQLLLYHSAGQAQVPLQKLLRQWGGVVTSCTNVRQAHDLAMTHVFAAILYVHPHTAPEELLAFISDLREAGCTTPCIAISNSLSHVERQRALAAGVTAYFMHPYSYTELMRTLQLSTQQKHGSMVTLIRKGGFELDLLGRTASFTGTPLLLTRREFDLLSFFLSNPGRVLTRTHIWEELWGHQEYPLANTIGVHVNRLRRKLPIGAREYLTSLYGVGYRLQVPDQLNEQ